MAEIHTMPSRKGRLYKADLPLFEQLFLPLIEDPSTPQRVAGKATEVLAYLGSQTISFNKAEYIMLFPHQQRAVARMLRSSRRPAVANELWAVCFENMTRQGEISFDRALFATELGVTPHEVSKLMSELVEFGALIREGTPRRYRYFLNHHVGTRKGLTKATDDMQAKAKPLELLPLPPSERRFRSVASLRPVL